jgi:hypothetical protein
MLSNLSVIPSDGHGHPKPLASHSNAHKKPITCLEFLEDRYDEYRINEGGAGEMVPASTSTFTNALPTC